MGKPAKPTQKGAFLISLEFRKCDTSVVPAKVSEHDIPLLILQKTSEVIEFLGRYTDYKKFCNNDYLAMKEELKRAVFVVDITNMEALEKDILCMDYPEHHNWQKSHYPEHRLGVHRLPFGVYKRSLFTDFIE